MLRTTLVFVGSLVVLAACAAPEQKGVSIRDVPVKLKPNKGQNELVVDEKPNRNCKGFSEKLQRGCVVVEANESVEVNFTLQQTNKYHLTRFEICPGKEKRDDMDAPCQLSLRERTEFALTDGKKALLPDENGQVRLTEIDPDLHAVTLVDKNTIQRDYFYRVQACEDGVEESEETCLWSDPPIINKGIKTFY